MQVLDASENALRKIKEIFIKKTGAKNLVAISDNVDFETMDVNKAICKIDDYIDELNRLKEELLEENEGGK